MSDFFESDSTTATASPLAGIPGPAGDVDREMRRQEMRRASTRRFTTRVIAVAIAGSLVLGGGFAAFGATHPSTTKKIHVASKSHSKSAKHKKHRKS